MDSFRKMGNPVPSSKITSCSDTFCVESSTLSTANCRLSMVRHVPMVSGSGALDSKGGVVFAVQVQTWEGFPQRVPVVGYRVGG